MPKTHDQLSERASESGIVASLVASPLYRERPATAFDVTTMLDAEELAAFVQATQPKEWAKLAKQFSGAERETLAAQVSALVQKRGTLEVLRNGVSFNGINLQLAFFKPSAGGNPEHQARYAGNRFAIVRQIHFSTKTPDQSVDVVILISGLPIVSIELKNHFTGQNVQHAIAQYRRRDPREAFFARCLVHFAVDDDAAYMATQLQGKETEFLPFNRDTENPIIYERFASSYLWTDFMDADGRTELGVLKADSLLELIQNYLHFERDEKTGKGKFIFPRFHQLMVVRKLLAHAKANGSGHNYLVQHSAGSGKSNSIAWLAHQLANLCGVEDQPVFDSVKDLKLVLTSEEQLKAALEKDDEGESEDGGHGQIPSAGRTERQHRPSRRRRHSGGDFR
jgi:type I restriction enzyme R subunit